jgi:hypothetical protein
LGINIKRWFNKPIRYRFKVRYLSWYETPLKAHRWWIKQDLDGSCYYVTDIEKATYFETEAEARKTIVVYDGFGSSDLQKRVGIQKVWF